jgi:Domain of unknown function (DUF4268)
MATFGKLAAVPIREGWPREDTEFTPWLATEDNLSLLSDEIGFSLELVETESGVGQYRADIVAKRVGTDETVVIENQFGKTDHSHLGQLLTYAAGVGAEGTGARTIVWIAESFTEPHRAALDWLNQCTEPGIRFFGMELQLWRIGNSAFAPKFNLVSRPNDWQKQLTQETAITSGTYQLYKEFWTAFIEYCGEETSLSMNFAPAQHWLPTSIGRTGFTVNLTASKRDKKLECQLWIERKQAKAAFAGLLARREAIVSALGSQVEFDSMPTKQPCKIFEETAGDINIRENWPTIHKWLKERGEAYVAVFAPLVKQLKFD